MSTENTKQLTLPIVSKAFMDIADVLLVLDDGVAMPCHSQTLSMHSAVLCNMLADLAGQRNEKIRIPLAGFTEAQCSALLKYLYSHGMSCSGAAFESHDAADLVAAIVVARFAHTYNAPHALQHVQVYLTAFMKACFMCKNSSGLIEETSMKNVLTWAVMADKFDMHELCGHCERAMVMYWDTFQDKPDLLDQLSSGALQRIAKGLNGTLVASQNILQVM